MKRIRAAKQVQFHNLEGIEVQIGLELDYINVFVLVACNFEQLFA